MFEALKHKFPINDKKWENYTHFFKRLEIPAKSVLLKEGDISKKLFLIEKGSLRAWFDNNGKDITFQFFFENNMVASVESFRKGSPSLLSIETIEPSIVWYIQKKELDNIIEEIIAVPELRTLFMDALFERTFDYMKHFLSSIKDSPQQRYLNLLKNNPEVTKRVPQHYIASYIGISSVHLSRIKGNLAKQKGAF